MSSVSLDSAGQEGLCVGGGGISHPEVTFMLIRKTSDQRHRGHSALQTLVPLEFATLLSGIVKWEYPPKDMPTLGNVPDCQIPDSGTHPAS